MLFFLLRLQWNIVVCSCRHPRFILVVQCKTCISRAVLTHLGLVLFPWGGGFWSSGHYFLHWGNFFILQKYMLDSLNHVHIWRVLPQLSCGDLCQICTWYGWSHEGEAVLLPGFAHLIAKPGNKTAPPLWPDPFSTATQYFNNSGKDGK